MRENKVIQIKISIYPNQLEWIEKISRTLNKPKRQIFLECFACYIGEFKQSLKGKAVDNKKKKTRSFQSMS